MTRAGVPFGFTLLAPQDRDAEAVYVQSQLRRVGVDADIQTMEWSVIFERDLPVTYLYPNVETSVASRRVRGLSTPHRADMLRYIDELWLET